MEFPTLLLRDARSVEGSVRPNAAIVQHDDAEGWRQVRARGAGGLFPPVVSDDLRQRFSQQPIRLLNNSPL